MKPETASSGISPMRKRFNILSLILLVVLPLTNLGIQGGTAFAQTAPTPTATGTAPTGTPTDTPTAATTATDTPTTAPTATATATSVPTATPTPTGPTVPILVQFNPAATAADITGAETVCGGQDVRTLRDINTHVIRVPASSQDATIGCYRQQLLVDSADPVVQMKASTTPNDPGYSQQWALPKIGWDQAYGSVSITGTARIAVLDTGVDASHPDLSGVLTTGISEIGGNQISDPNGHGTEMAGIAAASVNNSTGMAGVAYAGASVAPVQVLDNTGTGFDSDISAGILWAADNGAKVILMAFSGPTSSSTMADAVTYAQSKGVVVVAATGNGGSTAATYPSALPGVVGVAATDSNDSLTSYSNTGSAAVAAPGEGIYATQPGGNYGNVSGTSPASAEVAGEAALLMANGDGASQAASQIESSTDPISGATFGRIDIAKAMGVAPPATATATASDTPTPGTSPTASETPTPGATPTDSGTPVSTDTAVPTPTGTPVFEAASNVTVTGHVFNGLGTSGINQATITCQNCTQNGKQTAHTGTNNSGLFPASGSYTPDYSGSQTLTFCASATGFNSEVVSVVSPSGNFSATLEFHLTVGSNSTCPSTTGTANRLAFVTSPVSFTAGTTSSTITIQLQDVNGNPVSPASDVTVNLASNSSGTISFAPSAIVKILARTTTVSFTYSDTKAGTPTITASSSGLTSATQIETVTAAAANKLAFGQQPSNTNVAASITPAVTVSVEDQFGNVVTTNNSQQITMAIGTNPSGGVLSGGTPAQTASNGVATFSALSISKAGNGYTLTASTTGLTTNSVTSGTFNVGKGSQTITFGALANKTYGDADFGVTATASSGLTVSFAASGNCTVSGSTVHITGAGSCTITASQAGNGDYNAAPNVQQTFNIATAALSVTTIASSKVYGQANPSFSVSYATFVNGDTSASLGGTLAFSTTATNGSPAGSYQVTPSGLTSSNYTITFVAGTLTVTQATLQITADSKSKSYGAANPPLTASYSGFVNGDTSASLTTQPTIVTTATTGSHVGTYSITASGAVDSNYTISYVAGTLTVNAVALQITADNKSKNYGAALPALTASYSGFVNGDTSASLTTPPSIATTGTAGSHVGTYPITASGAVDSDYTISYVAGTLTVNPVALLITANNANMTYGGTYPASFDWTPTGLVNGDTKATVFTGTGRTAPSCSTPATASSHQGTYTITCSGAVSPDYTISYATGTFTVNPATLLITADNKSYTYGGTQPALTATYTGLVNGDTPATFSNSPNTAPTLSTTAAGSHAGSYVITISGAVNPDYTITQTNGTLTINQALLTITADNKSYTYGGAQPALTATYTGLVNGDTPATFSNSPNTAPTLSTTAAGSHAGSYVITISGAVNPDYTITQTNGTLTINRALLTITADNKSKVYAQANPTLTVTYSGLVNGDTPATFGQNGNTAPTIVTTATTSSHVGTYPITASGAVDHDYTISYAPGTLTVTPAALKITPDNKTMTYKGTVPTFTWTANFVNGDTAASLTTAPTCTAPVTSSTVAGVYTITCSGAVDPDYTISYVTGTITIIYGTGGYLQPVNDTAHGETCGSPCPMSVFKSGQTIPFKFQIKDAAGNIVGPDANPVTFTATPDGTVMQPIDESTLSITPDTGNLFIWDGQFYHYNWKSPSGKGGSLYLITATFANGQTVKVFIGLR